jgi:WD40 repeat protein
MQTAVTSYFITGGNLPLNAPSYVQRQADRDLYEGLLRGEYCYVLHARQMGKSSLMVHTTARLRQEGVAVVAFELTALGQNLTVEQWYDGLLSRIGRELGLEEEVEEYWIEHDRQSPLQRFMGALEHVVLAQMPAPIVIFLDEIDAVRSLPFSTDEFFAGLRECYNRRSEDSEFARLTFCLLGVAAPSDLIQDTRTTPFNIGRRIELQDFTAPEATLLLKGLVRPAPLGATLLQRVLYWTSGQPYLTQRLCRAVAEDPAVMDAAGVDRLCEELFLSPRAQERDDNLLFVRERLLRSEVDRASLLDLYAQVRRGKRIADDEADPLVSLLRLAGIVRAADGVLRVRNRIYGRVFDREWITTHMPDAELRRQRAAFRRGVLRATTAAALIVAVVAGLALVAMAQAHRADQERRLAQERELTARRLLYAADLKLAQQAWDAGNLRHAQELLNAHVPRPGTDEADLRGFAWRLLWRLCQDQSRTTLRPNSGFVGSVAYSPDGKVLASGGEKGTVKLWNLAVGEAIAVLKGHTKAVVSLAFSPDGQILASGSEDRTMRLWDARKSQVVLKIPGQTRSFSFSPDGETLAISDWNGRIRLWDLRTRRERTHFSGHEHGYMSLAFSPDGKILAGQIGLLPSFIDFWDLATRHRTARLEERTDPLASFNTALAFSPKGNTLAVGKSGGAIRLWSMAQRQVTAVLPGHLGPVSSVAFSPDGRTLASASEDNTIRLWDVTVPGRPWELRTWKGHTDIVATVAFSPDGKTLASGGNDQTVKLWSLAARPEAESLPGNTQMVWTVNFSPDGKILAAGGFDNTVTIWDAATKRIIRRLMKHSGHVTSLAFSPNGKVLATGSWDKTVKLWDLTSRREPVTLKGFFGFPGSLAFSPDGKRLASGAEGGWVKLWDLTTNRELVRFKAQEENIGGLIFSADGRLLATGGAGDPAVKLWDLTVLRRPRQAALYVKEETDNIWSIALSPDEKILATGSANGTVRFWDTATRQAVTSGGHAAGVNFVAFSPDGTTLASAGHDNTVRLWDVTTKREVAALRGHTGQVHSVAFSPDGQVLASGAWDRTVRLWRAATVAEADAPIYAVAGPNRLR